MISIIDINNSQSYYTGNTYEATLMLESVETLYNGRKYIRPVAAAVALKCDLGDLLKALSKHKKAVCRTYGTNALDKYGNKNFIISPQDKIYLDGWASFFRCFDDDLSKDLVKYLEKENAA